MVKRLIVRKFAILSLSVAVLSGAQAQTLTAPDRGAGRRPMPMAISSYEDDPFAALSVIERIDSPRFDRDDKGRLILSNGRVKIEGEDFIYRQDPADGVYKRFAWNPWPAPTANRFGDFKFQDEERFPIFRQERDADGKVILKDGLQVWSPNDLHLGMTTVFDAANAVIEAAEAWAGRNLSWGNDGLLEIETQGFVDFNALYSPSTRMLFFGVVPYRLKGETDVKMFETATSWEIAAHESGHAAHNALKPNVDHTDPGFDAWGESFGDQMAMWASLRNPDRAMKLLAETHGDLNQSNSLTRMCEAFAALVGQGTGMRDAFHDKKISDTTDEAHDLSEVLSGAAYKIFLAVYSDLERDKGGGELGALEKAGEIMGEFLTRATDYTPENKMTLEDVAKAFLKVDKEFFGGRYHQTMVDEFTRREIFDADSVNEWMAHEMSAPRLRLPRRPADSEVESMIQSNLDKLGIGPDFGLRLQSVIRENLFGRAAGFGQTIVRVQLTAGRGGEATPLDNHGILVFRRDGSLADYHAPLPPAPRASFLPDSFSQAQAVMVIGQAKQLSLDRLGAPLSLARRPDGQLTVEARVLRGEGLNAHMEVFTLDNPKGERREILIPPVPPGKRPHISNDLLN
jgi:hypothetical protein